MHHAIVEADPKASVTFYRLPAPVDAGTGLWEVGLSYTNGKGYGMSWWISVLPSEERNWPIEVQKGLVSLGESLLEYLEAQRV